MSLMVSISGIRGIVGKSLTPAVVVRYASAYAEYVKRRKRKQPEVVIGRDGRITGKILGNLISSTLLASGVNVRALGICSTPTVALAVEYSDAVGGISITASHNPIEWNGMKFFDSNGLFLDGEQNGELGTIADSGETNFASWNGIGDHCADDSWIKRHVDLVLESDYFDAETVRKRKLRVVVDCVNAAGGAFLPSMLRGLGCEVIEMNCDVSGVFAHMPEPIPENLADLAARVKKESADIGIAVDPDVDRLVLITETGEPYGEEYTVASAVQFVLGRESRRSNKKHSVVINLSTTRAVEDIARTYDANVHRTPVGEINVARKMKSLGSVIGGEGSGGVILPSIHTGRDAIAGIAIILQMLAEFDGTLSQLKASLPQYCIAKGKLNLSSTSPDATLKRIQENATGRISTEDGLRIDYDDFWVHLRKSNTEPIIRIIAEATSMKKALEVVAQFKKEIVG